MQDCKITIGYKYSLVKKQRNRNTVIINVVITNEFPCVSLYNTVPDHYKTTKKHKSNTFNIIVYVCSKHAYCPYR